jgi:TPR repeat protein/transglutaminase-like putative cysteine protease
MRGKLLIFLLFSLATAQSFGAAPAAAKNTASKAASNFVRTATLPKWAQPLADIPPSKHDDTVVVRLSETQAWVGPTPALLQNMAIQVNGKSALDSIGQFGIGFVPAYQKLLLHRVALLRGKEIIDRTASVNTRLLERETGLEKGVYGGAMTVQLLLEDVQVGDTLWLTYTVEGVNPVFGNLWSDTFAWDSASPVESRKLTILHPKSRPLQWRMLGDFKAGEIKPVIDQLGANERLVFSEQGIEALDFEESTPPDYVSHRRLQFSEFGNWHEVATWANGLFPRAPANPATTALVRKFAQQGDAMAQASAALHWVQDEIRYFSVSMGENSHRPQLPEVVLKHRYGDCKDKSYLLVSLLRDLGIKATPVLVSAQAPQLPGKMLPTPAQFDHVIVQVEIDGKRYNVDPTRSSERGSLAILPPAIPTGRGLLVDPASMELITLAESTQTEPQMERFEKIRIDALDGDAILEVRKIYRRRFAEFARLSLPSMSGAELRKSVLEQYEKQYPGITIAETPILKDSDDGASFELLMKFKLIKPVTHKDGDYLVEFDSKVVNDTLGIPPKLIRNFPFELPMGRLYVRYHLDILWPQVVRANIVGGPSTIDTPFFTLKEDIGLRGNHFHYNADYTVKRSAIPAAELPELQVHAKAMVEKLKAAATVSDAELVSQDGLTFNLRNLEIPRAEIDVIAFGKLYGKTKVQDVPIADVCDFLINSYALRAFLPNSQQLVDSLDGMLAAHAALPGYKLCRGKFKFSTGAFSASVPLLTAEASPADGDPNTVMLAWARFYGGADPAGALGDIRRFYEERKRKGVLSGYDIAGTVALLQRLHAEIPSELKKDGAMATAAWPYPIVAMQLGALSVDALLEKVNAMADDERELAANDAKFYIAQAYLAQGKTQLAIDTLRWFPPNGMRTTTMGQQALAELLRQTHGDAELNAGVAAWTKNDLAQAFTHFRKAAERGVPVAQYNVGMFSYLGRGTRQDVGEALRWFLLAAGNGVPDAMNYLGNMYNEGVGVGINYERALLWYEAGAKFGDFHASANLGRLYLKGTEGARQDYAKAFLHLSHGAEMGNGRAQADLSYLYTEGKGVAKDYPLAAYWARLSLVRDDIGGWLRVGILTRHGYGVKKDGAQAVKMFEHCAEKGSNDCAFQLALAYEAGDGVKQHAGKAQTWFERAADGGNAQAQFHVAKSMLAGDANSAKARALLIKAARAGEEKAVDVLEAMAEQSVKAKPDIELLEELGNIRRYADGSVFSYAKATPWYVKGVELGSALAMNNLADMYENGYGVEKNLDKALQLYRRSAATGYGFAFFSLGTLYKQGLGVGANPRLAFLYLEIASRKGTWRAKPLRDSLGKMLPAAERESAEALAAAWDTSKPLPML